MRFQKIAYAVMRASAPELAWITTKMEAEIKRSWKSGGVGLMFAVLFGVAISFMLRGTAGIGELVPQSETFERARAPDGSPSMSGRSSNLTVVLFTDYRCPACRGSDEAVIKAVQEDGRVDLIVRPVTLFGEESERAARVALAADKQGRFLAMHRALMSAAKIDDAGVAQAARRAGVNLAQLKADLVHHRHIIDGIINRNRWAAFGLGLAGTPSYLIGRYRVMGALSGDQLERVFRQARAHDAELPSSASKRIET